MEGLLDDGWHWAEMLGLTHLGDSDVLLDFNTPYVINVAID